MHITVFCCLVNLSATTQKSSGTVNLKLTNQTTMPRSRTEKIIGSVPIDTAEKVIWRLPGGENVSIVKCYPQGLRKAYCVSFDDGRLEYDSVMINSLRKNHIPATFFINSLHPQSRLALSNADSYRGFEIGSHGANHKGFGKMSVGEMIKEIQEDQKVIHGAFNRKEPVGFAYPYGDIPANRDLAEAAFNTAGICYARGTKATRAFRPPKNFFSWDPDGSIDVNMLSLLERYQCLDDHDSVRLMMQFAHAVDFVNGRIPLGTWDIYLQRLSLDKTIWKATMMEVCQYVLAMRQVGISGKGINNPSSLVVWLGVNGKTVKIKPHQTLKWKAIKI